MPWLGWLELLIKTDQLPLFDSALAEKRFRLTPGVTSILSEVLWQQAESAQPVVPPMVEIDDGAAVRIESALNLPQHCLLVVFPSS